MCRLRKFLHSLHRRVRRSLKRIQSRKWLQRCECRTALFWGRPSSHCSMYAAGNRQLHSATSRWFSLGAFPGRCITTAQRRGAKMIPYILPRVFCGEGVYLLSSQKVPSNWITSDTAVSFHACVIAWFCRFNSSKLVYSSENQLQ